MSDTSYMLERKIKMASSDNSPTNFEELKQLAAKVVVEMSRSEDDSINWVEGLFSHPDDLDFVKTGFFAMQDTFRNLLGAKYELLSLEGKIKAGEAAAAMMLHYLQSIRQKFDEGKFDFESESEMSFDDPTFPDFLDPDDPDNWDWEE
jgi:hypothetical protein